MLLNIKGLGSEHLYTQKGLYLYLHLVRYLSMPGYVSAQRYISMDVSISQRSYISLVSSKPLATKLLHWRAQSRMPQQGLKNQGIFKRILYAYNPLSKRSLKQLDGTRLCLLRPAPVLTSSSLKRIGRFGRLNTSLAFWIT